MSQEQAIASIERGVYSFYVERPARDQVAVIVATSAQGNNEADGEQPNNLLSLPECP
jgi:hypothetical protein